MLFIALAIKLDSRGPVFFRQPRLGFNQKIFHVYKFRTMYVADSDKLGDQLTRKGDKRITRLGNLLRKSSLDELPQLLNVLSGDMSIVGPRPHPLNAKAADKRYDEVVDGYAARHRVKPGITGWAQVNGWRGETDTYEKIEKRVEHDLSYIERWSVLFDLRIILRTAVHGFYHDNAF
jgi:lipopolysaccharide/colanic/teichoic acid biosynthesis glycosyltransferase